MDNTKFEKIIIEQIKLCQDTLCGKAKEYATTDRLHNFKQAGHLQRNKPTTALAGMMCKHTVSIYDMLYNYENGVSFSIKLWDEKITDHINYLLLLKALIIYEIEETAVTQ